MKPLKPVDVTSISPERRRIAMILETHVEKAIEELGAGCNVTLQGRFDETHRSRNHVKTEKFLGLNLTKKLLACFSLSTL